MGIEELNYLKHYKPTETELRMAESLCSHGITKPAHLETEKIQIAYRVLVMEMDFPSASFGRLGIVLKKGITGEQYKSAFYHEFAHWLGHSGNQLQMNKQQKLAQEVQANQMSLYLRVPYHMLELVDFSSDDCIIEVADIFNVPVALAKKRVQKIKDNILCNGNSQLLSANKII
ncbi:ImmA/IrrE family metallo-endopeptidase [Listeria newyorkensis]|uniref:ImmA/IrrE family metallo-endopeptidase n=1 Tax=Listeria newyorkensis TaxID=1497681 RepID=A0A841Z2P7_9LIST|nr:ImmA/IrrE family metallo-endopeptidase [Listeria newyorkensis]MBC1459127.1 ImmA/IrrE family metallo-endopeptidase [Listeria newyorkensis]